MEDVFLLRVYIYTPRDIGICVFLNDLQDIVIKVNEGWKFPSYKLYSISTDIKRLKGYQKKQILLYVYYYNDCGKVCYLTTCTNVCE
jgi:hypothetical protein